METHTITAPAPVGDPRTLLSTRTVLTGGPAHSRPGIADPCPIQPRAVFVDLDNTLIKGSALFHIGRALASGRLVSRRSLVQLAGLHALYRLIGENARMVEISRNRALGFAAGLSVDDVLAGVSQVYDQAITPRLWAGTLRLLEAHRTAGVPIWLATAAPVELARLIADRLGLSGALGTQAEQRDGVWTGRLTGPVCHGHAKAIAVAALARHQGWPLTDCIGYSDSLADLPLLTSVGHPVVVNPERSLRHIANAQHWPIHDFRARRPITVRTSAPVGRTDSPPSESSSYRTVLAGRSPHR